MQRWESREILKNTFTSNPLCKTRLSWQSVLARLKNNHDTSKETFKFFKSNAEPIFLSSNLGLNDNKIYVVSIDVTENTLNTDFKSKVNRLAKLGGWSYNPELDIVKWSDTVFEILDIDQRFDIQKEDIFKYIHPHFVEFYKSVLDSFYENLEGYDVSFKVITESKIEKWVRVTANPNTRNGEVVFVYGT